MSLNRIQIVCLLLFLPLLANAQFFGIGGQYAESSHGQFFISTSRPSYYKKNILDLNMFVSSGLEFTTSGGANLAGLNIKPIQISTYFNESFYNNSPITALLSVDAGYLFDFRRHHRNTLVITPNLYLDYSIFFIRTGYDIDTFYGKNQFFVRAGIGFGLGSLKKFLPTQIR